MFSLHVTKCVLYFSVRTTRRAINQKFSVPGGQSSYWIKSTWWPLSSHCIKIAQPQIRGKISPLYQKYTSPWGLSFNCFESTQPQDESTVLKEYITNRAVNPLSWNYASQNYGCKIKSTLFIHICYAILLMQVKVWGPLTLLASRNQGFGKLYILAQTLQFKDDQMCSEGRL